MTLPKAGDVLQQIEGASTAPPSVISDSERAYLNTTKVRSIEAQMMYEHLKGVEAFYKHRGRWSWFLMTAVGSMLIFQSVLLVYVGQGRLDFTQYEWLLPALLVQNLGQVIGLAVYAVKYLFSDGRGTKAE